MTTTIMEQEARQTPSLIRDQLKNNQAKAQALGESIRNNPPKFVYIIGRGSSDHAGVFGKYLIEIEAGITVAHAAPSVASVYDKQLDLSNTLVLAISQSGRSPDILSQLAMAKNAGATTVALVNDETSPLAEQADFLMPLGAGEEKAVAATKSYLCTLSAITQIVAHWTQNQALLDALDALPEQLQAAIDAERQLTTQQFQDVHNCVVLGRGLGYAVSREIALKLKEVCSIHAESYSSAEFVHGPIALAGKRILALEIDVHDESRPYHQEQIIDLQKRGSKIIHLNQVDTNCHPRTAPLLVLQKFYVDIATVSTELGYNPDAPQGLNKVTRTQ
ncbi:glutamine--fructose-6-phosphate aminotransferase [Saccharobesus litoralis]|uniref:Glutamine--fructose-6-phosphate aminotransferase n=1 Tax=Saccharobesus litoralis TaxID=2172099 RepID=A0A2S0VV15_9ALTE|nr:SIS domain-containing protein [Saccharobesus litoralis]AWB68066.1 glutamine--fructose-6-phosphate aminotransferase [Saccharobesus litoralis]